MKEMRGVEDITSHYYSEHPDTVYDSEQWVFELKGRTFQFAIDSGISSRETTDYGLHVLIDTFDWEELPDEGKISDTGCGYGPIGLALVFTTQRFVETVDISERAVSLTQGNAKRSQVKQVDIHQSNIYEVLHEETYAAIISNPLIRAGKKAVRGILTGAYPRLKQDGALTTVIQKKQGAPSAQRKMEETFSNAEVVTEDKGYYIIRGVKE